MAQAAAPSGLKWLRKWTTPLEQWTRSHSSSWQAAAGTLVAFPLPILVVIMVMLDRPQGAMISTMLCGPAALLAGWLLFPYFQELPRKSQSRIVLAPVLGYIGLVALFTACSLLLGAADRGQAAMLLFLVWIYHTLTGTQFEPSRFPYEHLRFRLLRAAPMRVFTMWCALIGLLWLMQYARGQELYKVALFGATVTLCGTGVAATHRLLARTRRLRTELDKHAAELMTALEELRTLPDEDKAKQKFAVQRAWKALQQTLANRVDTGVSISGVFVLPKATIAELEKLVLEAQRSQGTNVQAYRGAVARLRMICMACTGKTDTLA
ncbi:hypothetical protein [Streptomyces sp. NPDC058374]|uniref:hypothetical protein n=1 Tax=Streptomyces sp. NPDC058374 TaxID=3346466 RepID=UPI00365DF005